MVYGNKFCEEKRLPCEKICVYRDIITTLLYIRHRKRKKKDTELGTQRTQRGWLYKPGIIKLKFTITFPDN